MPSPYKSTGEPSRTVIGAVTDPNAKPVKKKYPKLITYGLPLAGIGLVYWWMKR